MIIQIIKLDLGPVRLRIVNIFSLVFYKKVATSWMNFDGLKTSPWKNMEEVMTQAVPQCKKHARLGESD